jgi:two-component system phosphate regulon sensor histidine kinase PhoR
MSDTRPGETPVLDALADGVIVVQEGRITYGNPAASGLLGVALPDVLARLAPAVLGQLVVDAFAEGRAESVFERGQPSRWIEAVARPLPGVDDGAVLVLHDVTERRRVEAIRRDFVADASHELKTPAASIQAAAETLLRALDQDPDDARRFAHQVEAAASRLSHLVDDLLDLSRLESERPEFHSVDVAPLVSKEIDRVADRAEVGGVDLAVDLDAVTVLGSRKDLRLAVRNLIENAIAYTPVGGSVSISTRQTDGEVVITVADTGVGIPEGDLPRIFERFYRVDDARNRETGGTGLGLAIVRHVAELHGGAVRVDSRLGDGAIFQILLPRLS